MKKNLTPEQMEKRKTINKKIMKFGCLPIAILIVIIVILSNIKMDINKYRELRSVLDTAYTEADYDIIFSKLIDLRKSASDTSVIKSIDSLLINKDEWYKFHLKANKVGHELIERQRLINSQFSKWNGSHINLVKLVKKNMNDPSSFEHVETKYKILENDKLYIIMRYRGTNAFGAIVTNDIACKADFYGNILEIIE